MAWSASNAILIVCALCLLTPLVTYIIAVHKGHVDPFLPHIGTIGDNPPESTLFTQLLVLTTAFTLLVIHTRFVYVALYCEMYRVEESYARLNLIAICIGYVMCFGLLVLASFQESNAFYVHKIASIVLFTTGSFFYIMMQTIISYRIRNYTHTKRASLTRVALNFIIFICMSLYLIGLILCKARCSTVEGLKGHRRKTVCKYHIISAVSEWLLTFLYAAYALTFYNEFRLVKLTMIRIEVVFHGESPAVDT